MSDTTEYRPTATYYWIAYGWILPVLTFILLITF